MSEYRPNACFLANTLDREWGKGRMLTVMDVYERSATPSRGKATHKKAVTVTAATAPHLEIWVVSLLMRRARGGAGEMWARTEGGEGANALGTNTWAVPRQDRCVGGMVKCYPEGNMLILGAPE